MAFVTRAEVRCCCLSKVLTLVMIYFDTVINISYSFACQIRSSSPVPLSRRLFLEVKVVLTVHLQRSLFVLESVSLRLLISPPFPNSITNKEGAHGHKQVKVYLLTVFRMHVSLQLEHWNISVASPDTQTPSHLEKSLKTIDQPIFEESHNNMTKPKNTGRPRLDVKKDDPAQVEDLVWPFAETPKVPKGKWRPYKYFGPERTFKEPRSFRGGGAPLHIVGKELGLPGMGQDSQQDTATPERTERSTSSPVCLPKIYLGDASPAPRWLIRPADPENKQNSSRESSASSGSRLPSLGKLRWEFDPGMRSKHGLDEAWLRDYAYQYLLNSLCDPIVRDEMRELIWNGPHAPTVTHVEDPLPVPPPPPHFKDKKPLDYVSLRRPISASAPDDYYFTYSGYERPRLAARVRTKADVKADAEGANSNADPFSTGYDDSSDWEPANNQDRPRGNSELAPNVYASTRRSSASTIVNPSTRSRTDTGRSWYSGVSAKEFSKHTGSEASDSAGYNNLSSDDNDQHISSDSSNALSIVTSSEDELTISKPPKRGNRRPNKTSDRAYVYGPTLEKLPSEDLSPRKQRRELRTRTQNRPTSAAFSDDEDIPLPRLPKKVKKSTTKKKTAKRQ
ncbi:hypothetical protein BJY00DRAFT_11352 [Aspergillus carlsbadensis]|nr:hypothetical protein BJY00DRAFT_11352 [Aspergillus carlsbadensis]